MKLSTNKCPSASPGKVWKYTRVVSPQKPLKIRENWCVPILCETVSRENCCMRERLPYINCCPVPVHVEGSWKFQIFWWNSLMNPCQRSYGSIPMKNLRGASWGQTATTNTGHFFCVGPGRPRGICLALVLSQLAIACVAVHWSSFAMVPLGLSFGSESWRMWFLLGGWKYMWRWAFQTKTLNIQKL